jgi:hypothetical protein
MAAALLPPALTAPLSQPMMSTSQLAMSACPPAAAK